MATDFKMSTTSAKRSGAMAMVSVDTATREHSTSSAPVGRWVRPLMLTAQAQ